MTEGPTRTDMATVLFTDLVGSTRLRSRLGEVRADELRHRHDELVRVGIESNRGRIVKHLGDGVMATFSGATDAIGGAVAVQQAIADHNRRADAERLEVRIGLSCGDVTFEGDDCFGLPVVEAQRLESVAEPGQILCSEVVQVMARGRGTHTFADLGPIDLKGLDAPLRALIVEWQPTQPDLEAVMPRMLASAGRFAFAGRRAALGRLQLSWRSAVEGEATVVLVSGEPGIGKSRLVSELARHVLAEGGILLAGRCDEHARVPNRPFIEALRHQLAVTPPDLVVEQLGPRANELARLVPEVADIVPKWESAAVADPETKRFQLLDAVARWLRATAACAPTLLVLDDLHWADVATLPTVRYVAEQAAGSRLFIVATYRETEVPRDHPLAATLSALARLPGASRLALEGLDTSEVEEFLELAGDAQLDENGRALSHTLHRETGGNPLFIGEVLRHLIESGQLVRNDDRWIPAVDLDEIGIPDGIREVIGQRLAALSDDAETVLSAAAVIGHEVRVEILSSMLGRSIERVLDGLEEATAAGLVEEVGLDRYRFTHALVFATLRDDVSISRRSRLQRMAAIPWGDPLASPRQSPN